jgi:hypothetical protein
MSQSSLASEQDRPFAGLIASACFVLCVGCPREDRQATNDEDVAARAFARRGWRQHNFDGRIRWLCPDCAPEWTVPVQPKGGLTHHLPPPRP